MNITKTIPWPLILALGGLALARPLVRIVTDQLDISTPTILPIILTLVVSAIWIIIVGLSRMARPVLILLFAGLTYAVLAIILSGILSPILTGKLQGPLAMPIAIVPMLVTNAIWGLVTGVLALLLQRLRGRQSRDATESIHVESRTP